MRYKKLCSFAGGFGEKLAVGKVWFSLGFYIYIGRKWFGLWVEVEGVE